MTSAAQPAITIAPFDAEMRGLVRLAAMIAAGSEAQIRTHLAIAVEIVRPDWVEELILQSYLFAGFPRTLNAMREWRRVSGRPAPERDDRTDYGDAEAWRSMGEETCAVVYGPFYEKLRHNIRDLHPALDAWMIVDGYGKVLSRPALPLWRRELCIVAACAASAQERQLHSHLHGALHAGATPEHVDETLGALADLVDDERNRSYALLWAKVRNTH